MWDEKVRSKGLVLGNMKVFWHTQQACLGETGENKNLDRVMGRGWLQDQAKEFVIYSEKRQVTDIFE